MKVIISQEILEAQTTLKADLSCRRGKTFKNLNRFQFFSSVINQHRCIILWKRTLIDTLRVFNSMKHYVWGLDNLHGCHGLSSDKGFYENLYLHRRAFIVVCRVEIWDTTSKLCDEVNPMKLLKSDIKFIKFLLGRNEVRSQHK